MLILAYLSFQSMAWWQTFLLPHSIYVNGICPCSDSLGQRKEMVGSEEYGHLPSWTTLAGHKIL